MNPQHFKELIGTVKKTSGYTTKEIAARLGVHYKTVFVWRRNGVPNAIKPYVVSVLREMCFSGGKWRKAK